MDLIKDLFKGDKVIWIIFLFLCLISIVEVFSAASTLTYKSGDHWGPITQHSVILMVGVCIVVLVHNIPYKYFRVFPVFLLPLSTLLLIFVMGMGLITGDRVNGAARWMTFFGIQFQPSELAKMAVIIVTAFILSKFQEEDNANPKAFKYIMWITGIVFILIAPENGSTAALLFGVVFLMMVIGRVPWKQLAKLMGIDIWLLMRAGKIARRSEKSFPAFLVMGIALLLVSQAMLNMMVAVGLFPVTGQPLPLISKGGTSTLINCAYIGMILSVSRYVAEKEEQKAAEQQAQKEAELAAKTERHQEMVAAMQEAITTLPSGDNATTSLPPEENSLPDDLKAMLNAAGKREPEEEI